MLAAALAVAGCGRGSTRELLGGPTQKVGPVAVHGAVTVSTRNTARLGGEDGVADAAAVARVAYSGLTPATRPPAAVLVDEHDWSAALAAASLASAPLGAPLLYSEGNTLPALSAQTLQALRPRGSAALGEAQVIRIATTAPVPAGLLSRSLPAAEPAVTGAAIEALLRAANGGRAARQAIVLAANAPRALQMPAAGLAAQSGAPILFVNTARIPIATAETLASMHRPSIYVIDAEALGAHTLRALAHFGPVSTISSGRASAISEAIAVARYTDGTFGWGVKEPGHGLVFANTARPLDAPAAALLSATADYGPMLLLEAPSPIPPALAVYLGDIQPAYAATPQLGPVRGVYNHGWLIGDESAISATTQAELDVLLQISPRKQSAEESTNAPPE